MPVAFYESLKMSSIKQILVKIAFIFYFMLSFVTMIFLYFLDLVISVIGEFSKLTRWHFGEKKVMTNFGKIQMHCSDHT